MESNFDTGNFEPKDRITARDMLDVELDTRLWPIKDAIEEFAFALAEAVDHEEKLIVLQQFARMCTQHGYMQAHVDIFAGPHESSRVISLMRESYEESNSELGPEAPSEE
jgi:hypothetical protein